MKFREKHSNDISKYVLLREADLPRLFDIYRLDSGSTSVAVLRLARQFESNAELKRQIDQIVAGENEKIERLINDVRALEKSAENGKIVEFEFVDGDKSEWGFLILRDGEIVKRTVWGFAPYPLN